MTFRTIRLGIFAICGLAAVLLVSLLAILLIDYRDYQKVEITSALLAEGKYDPALHFTFDRACVFPPESGLAHTWLTERGYHEQDKIFPDTFTNWTVVLIDDNKKTFRTLYVLEPSVKFGGGIICDSNLRLETVKIDGQVIAYAKEASGK